MDDFYTVRQAALTLKVHPLTIRRYIREGKLKAYRIGGSVRIALNDLRGFTQSFIPRTKQPKQIFTSPVNLSKEFSFSDTLFQVQGKGSSVQKQE